MAFLGILGSVFIATIYPSVFGLPGENKIVNEGAAVSSLRNLYDSQATYFGTTKKSCGTLEELYRVGLIDEKLASGQKSEYKFVLIKTENICAFTAIPVSSQKGSKSFFISTQVMVKFMFPKIKPKLPI